MKEWPSLLPRVMNSINGMHPAGSQFSRTHLLFSPFMLDSPLLGTRYPVLTQASALQGEHERRAKTLHKHSKERLSNKVDKSGMAITITNLRTEGTSIDLEQLTDINFGIPDIFERVRKLNTLNRNWAQPGNISNDIQIVKDPSLKNQANI